MPHSELSGGPIGLWGRPSCPHPILRGRVALSAAGPLLPFRAKDGLWVCMGVTSAVGVGVGGLDVRFVEEGAKWLDDGWWRRAMRKTKGNTIWISVTK